ncbi:hydroxymethylglutaryl-CoA lyase [Calderihabitans maritimus]|uniref:Hydroxymethylglutaryl-CoA lyase n=1 Tax=Calderihabitans maritimus TaxID=1246530 RepID=A0A1Z5HTV5_9FIRM|nr:hydroxymethylglutaryl-CoA lyase [Calderihabitans maritimus]GAW92963.1 Hydroxymethylglutaryl-CoA lyase [Calderihabitans maritimus]
MKLQLPKSVQITELLARDGLQNEDRFIPTETKIYFVNACSELGFACVEVTNFSHPKYLPQFRDAEEVLKRIKRKPGVIYKCYGMSDKAFERAARAKEAGYGPDVMAFTLSISETHNLRNANRTHKEYWEQIPRWIKLAHSVGIKVDMALATVFGCPIEGPVPISRTFEFIERGLELGVDSVTPCDTTGEASPDRVFEFYSELRERFPDQDVHAAHFHDSRGMALANNLAALLAGVTKFESSLGQLGGQPAFIVDGVPGIGTGPNYCPSELTGNCSTEDLVVMFDEMGIDTGVDVDKVLELGRLLERVLGRDLRPYCTKTGRIPKGRTYWNAIPPYNSAYWAYPQRPMPEGITEAASSKEESNS